MFSFNMLLEDLAQTERWSYLPGGPIATEPAGLAAWALISHNRADAAMRPLDWLVGIQASDGSLGVTATEKSPRWPTALAILAWQFYDRFTCKNRYADCIERSVRWAFSNGGTTFKPNRQMGHDPTLVAWPWVIGTHSWQEPSALFVIALTAAGYGNHSRVQQAIRLLVDRLLPNGGCNYGNTRVLGRELLPQIQTTGLTMLALAGKSVQDARIGESLRYLENNLGPNTATVSLCFGLLGLTAHHRRPSAAEDWLDMALRRNDRQNIPAYQKALITLASLTTLAPPVDRDIPQKTGNG
ncbi:MAG: hypothetical protein JW829_02305 [Pirellulales bacterium]|nr:hypothetical protein [Pirellulales bacterium]